MHIWTIKEWSIWYDKVGRKPFAHLSKEQRQRIVRGCIGKVIYDSRAEAEPIAASHPPIEGKGIGIYKCPLCHGFHIGNSTARKEKRMSTTAITLETRVTNLQTDLKSTLEEFFASLPEMNSLAAQSAALVEQSKSIVVFRRDQNGKIVTSDAEAFVKASEQTQALGAVEDQISASDKSGIMDPFIDRLFKAHRAATAIRNDYLLPIQTETKRLKLEREQFAAEEERKRREAAQKAQEEARQREEARLIEEARLAAAQGDSVAAEAILEEAMNVQAPAVVLPSATPRTADVSYRSVWEWTLLDVNKLKPEFLTPKENEIGVLVRSMHSTAETLVGIGAINVTERKIVVDR